ncbi:MAG: carbon storage regulator [Planctomyces sp.]|jgi:carbon storage regulator CsrA
MLVLSRKKGETIQVSSAAGEIRITVAEVRGGRVRLSIEAPRSVRVLRSELMESTAADLCTGSESRVEVETTAGGPSSSEVELPVNGEFIYSLRSNPSFSG